MYRLACGLIVVSLFGCDTGTTALPPAPGGAGELSGRLVVFRPGLSAPQPAAGASLQVLQTNVRAESGDDGRFVLGPIVSTEGLLLIRFDARPDGTFGRQRLLALKELNAGPGRKVFTGDIVLRENATAAGRALLGDRATERSGHRGITVFLPEGPFTTYTGDDGAYLFGDLPEGDVTLMFFRDGYAPSLVGPVTLRSGEALTLRDVVLEKTAAAGATVPVEGRVRTDPAAADPTRISVIATGASGSHTFAVDAEGRFSDALAPGLYTIVYSMDGYGAVTVPNVFVPPPVDGSAPVLVLADVTLAAEQPPEPEDPVLQPPPTIGIVSRAYGATSARFVLDASGSVGVAGHPLSYSWRQTSGDPVVLERNDSPEAVRTGFVAPSHPDTLIFELEVEDTATGRAADVLVQVEIVVPPAADAFAPAYARPGSNVTLDATDSTGPHPLSFAWRQLTGAIVALPADGPGASRATFTTPAAPQGLSFELTVTDTVSGLSAVDTVALEVVPAPVARITSPALGRTGAPFTLDATASTGPEGHLLSFGWRQLEGPVVALDVTDGTAAALATFVAPPAPRRLTFELTVTDVQTSLGTSLQAAVDFDDAPTIRIGSPPSGQAGARFELDASGTSGPPGHELSFTWTQRGGDAVTLSRNASPDASRTEFIAPVTPQLLTFELTVLDTRTRFTSTASTTVTLQTAPFAIVRAPARVQAGAIVQLDATQSTGPEGHGLSFHWRQSRGDSVQLSENDSTDAATPTFPAPARAQFVAFDLTVVDVETGLSATASAVVEVQVPPTALVATPPVARTGGVFRLDGSPSSSPSGAPLVYGWRQVAGDSVTLSDNDSALAATPSFTVPPRQQVLEFTLTVTDLATNLQDQANVSVVVLPPPVAVVSPDAIVVRPGARFHLDGTQSYDPLGATLTSFAWTLLPTGTDATLDSTTSPRPLVTAGQQAFVVQLVVSTSRLASDPTSVTVQLNPGAVVAPALSLNAGLLEVTTGATVTLVATATHPDPTETVAITWTQAGGTTTPLLVTVGANGTSNAVFRAPDSYTTLIYDVTATASGGGRTTKSVTVEVQDRAHPKIVRSAPATDNGAGPAFFAFAQFDEDVDPGTLLPDNLHVLDSQGNRLAGELTYDPGTYTVRLIYDRPLATGRRYVLVLDGIRDRSPNSNPMPLTRLNFGASAPRWDLLSDASGARSGTPNRPRILWSPERVTVIAQRHDLAACPYATYGHLYALDVTSAGALQPVEPGACRHIDYRPGDFGPVGVQAGGVQFAYTYNGALYRRLNAGFVPSGSTCCQLGSDGSSMYTMYESYGLNVASWNATTNGFNPAARVEGSISTWVGHDMAMGGDGQVAYVAGPVYGSGQLIVSRRSATGAWSLLGRVGGANSDAGAPPRVRVRRGMPVIVSEERVAGTWKVRAYQGSQGTSGITFRQLGGGDANTGSVSQSDGAIIGNTLYVALAQGGQVFVRHVTLDDPAEVWVDDPGPAGPSLNVDGACLADRPSLDAAPDGLWLAWSENCSPGTPNWKVYARKLTSGPAAPTFPLGGGSPRLTVDAVARLVETGSAVTMTATAESLDPANTLTLTWEQVSGEGVTLTTEGTGLTSTARFTAPATASTLTFRVTVYGALGGSAEKLVTVDVEDRTPPRIAASTPAVTGGAGPALAATVTFDEPIDAATVTVTNVRVEAAGGAALPATVHFTPPATLRLTYAAPLVAGSDYVLKLSGIADASPTHNVMAPVEIAFSASAPAWSLYKQVPEQGSVVSNRPWILAAPWGISVVGDRLDTLACPGSTYGFVWNLDVQEPDRLVMPGAPTCRNIDYRNGDFGPKGVLAGGRIYAYTYNGAFYQRNANAWFPAGAGCCQVASDGGSAFVLYESYGLNLAPFNPQANDFGTAARVEGSISTWKGHEFSGGGTGGTFHVIGPVYGSGQVIAVRREPGGTFTLLGRAGGAGATDVVRPRVLNHGTAPVYVTSELVAGSWRVRAYKGLGGTPYTWRWLGAANVNAAGSVMQSDAAIVGDTLYVAMNVAGGVVVRRVDLNDAAAAWVDVPGPAANLNDSPTCSADRPSLTSTDDALWLAWSESCGTGSTPWRVKVRALR